MALEPGEGAQQTQGVVVRQAGIPEQTRSRRDTVGVGEGGGNVVAERGLLVC